MSMREVHEMLQQSTLRMQYHHQSTFNPVVLNVNFLNMLNICPLNVTKVFIWTYLL